MRAMCLLLACLALSVLFCSGCARHTYLVELNDNKTFYADPPLVLDSQNRLYRMWIAGKQYRIPMDDVRYIDDAAQVCYQNGFDDTYTCFDALYQY
ncbi:hypothetical protein [Solidesulfovibrio sp. C21]|uniref:hypothetical protein n=1 Tax=Solidesulfovibrio sp. C21 TaxID=3398613 RepID=UPI0039FBA827